MKIIYYRLVKTSMDQQVLGRTADNANTQLGNYNGQPSVVTTVLQGIKDKLKNADVFYSRATDFTATAPQDFSKHARGGHRRLRARRQDAHARRPRVEKAKTQLAAPLTLFALPASAACRVTEAKVEVEIGEHRPRRQGGGQGAKREPTKGDGHSEFHVEYALECAAPGNLTAIEFGYFRAFAGAQKLDVNVITPKGQSKFEVTRASPSLSLAGMI